MSFISAVARLTVLEACRTRLPWLLTGVCVAALGLAAFVSQVAITESREIQITFLAALLRLAAVLLTALFAISSLQRDAADKITDMLIAQPVPRSSYFLGKLTGVLAVAMVIALAASLVLAGFAPAPGVLAWGTTLFGELLVISALAMFCALSLPGMVGAIAATAGFYLLSRSIDTLQFIAAHPLVPSGDVTDSILRWLIDGIALLLPGLDDATRTIWLIDAPPAPGEWAVLMAEMFLYAALLSAATLFDLYRKSF